MPNLVTVGSKKGKTRHFIDADKYTRVSRSKALCGKKGSDLIMFDAVFFNYEVVYPIMCKKCNKLAESMSKKAKKEMKEPKPRSPLIPLWVKAQEKK